jgi:hypothetical protein
MCANATPPGGIVATFIDRYFEPTFFADMPGLYLIPFQDLQFPGARMTRMPSSPSTQLRNSSSDALLVSIVDTAHFSLDVCSE